MAWCGDAGGECSKNSSLLPDNGQKIVGLVRVVRSDLVGFLVRHARIK